MRKLPRIIPKNACLSVVETARYLRVRPPTVRALIRSGELRAIIIGNRPRISPAALAEFEAAKAAKPMAARMRREAVPAEVLEILGSA